MKIFNSKTNTLEAFVPIRKNQVSMYVCGPTVYNHAHIGNARPIVVFDLLRRVLETKGYDVTYVSNYTDVDDKIIRKAIDESVSEKEISARYIVAYESIRKGLHAQHLYATPKVTEVMDSIIAFIGHLVDKGYAYEIEGDVYFRVGKVSGYGEISHQNIDELRVGSRIEENENKENPLDFALWKVTSDEGIKWDSPWGKGRPGWHTECVVMIHDVFGMNKIDIHGGGQDLKFPHHENESAQCKALHDHDLANYWVHNAMLNIDGEKMSKSLGNVVWAKDFIEQLGENVTRLLLLSTHYRLVLNINDDAINQAVQELNRIETALKKAAVSLQLHEIVMGEAFEEELYDDFLGELYDDLNVANALSVLYEALKRLNQSLRTKELDFDKISQGVNTVEKMVGVLGLDLQPFVLTQQQKEWYQAWEQAKSDKDYETADRYRQQLIDENVL